MDAVKIVVTDLVRTRRQSRKFMLMKANIQVKLWDEKTFQLFFNIFDFQAVSLKIETLKSQNTMAQATKWVSRAMMNIK